jgi:hypothetical protein
MPDDTQGRTLWIAYKHDAKEIWENMERHPDPTSCDWVVTDPLKTPMLRKIEVALLEQVKYVGSKFLRGDVPDNWDFLVYLEMMGKKQSDTDPQMNESKPYGFVQLSFF